MIAGLIETQVPEKMRHAIRALQQEILNDAYYAGIPSLEKTRVAFHAKDDIPEVRERFFRLIKTFEFRAQFAFARKTEQVFRDVFQSRPQEFYDHLVSYSFEKVLHRYEHNHIYIAGRGASPRLAPLTKAIDRGRAWFERKCGSVGTTVDMQVQTPGHEPCLSVVDYMTWALYRAITRGETRYFDFMKEKVSLVVDLYDNPRRWYDRGNPFDIRKITPL